MDKYISIETLVNNIDWDNDLQKWTLRGDPEDIPTADVVELKHGYWEPIVTMFTNDEGYHWSEHYLRCTVCGHERRREFKPLPTYCEGCTARMESIEKRKSKEN